MFFPEVTVDTLVSLLQGRRVRQQNRQPCKYLLERFFSSNTKGWSNSFLYPFAFGCRISTTFIDDYAKPRPILIWQLIGVSTFLCTRGLRMHTVVSQCENIMSLIQPRFSLVFFGAAVWPRDWTGSVLKVRVCATTQELRSGA